MSQAGWVGYLVLAGAVAAVGVAIGLCVKYIVRPGEQAADHIKRRVLR